MRIFDRHDGGIVVMGFAENFPRMNASQLAVFGEPIVYILSGEAPMEIQGILIRGEDLEDANWQAAIQASAVLYVREADVASPGYQDTVSADGETWTVARKISKSGGMWKLEVRRDLRPTFRR